MALDTAAVAAWMADFADQVHRQADLLTELDRKIGDADHGSNMERGTAAVAALDPAAFSSPSTYLRKAGMTLVSTVGGASGPLYGTFLMRVGAAWPSDGSATGLGAALRAGLDGVVQRGKAEVGDKTMVDALAPALRASDAAASTGVAAALAAAAKASARGCDDTAPLVARKGRASYLGERSVGVQDPGATSMMLLLEAAARTLV